MSGAVSIVRADGEGEHLRFWGGGVLTIKASAEETGGAFLLFEDFMSQGKTTPLHIHANEDETLYVLEGEIMMQLRGAEPVTVKAGEGFYEGPNDVHIVGRSASDSKPAKFVVFLVKNLGVPAVLPAK